MLGGNAMKFLNQLSQYSKQLGIIGIAFLFCNKAKRVFKEVILDFRLRSRILKSNIKYIYGPLNIQYAEDELIALCCLRNGELYIESFMAHHQSMGIRHFVFMDNGSTDRTIAMLQKYENVTILQHHLDFMSYENAARRYLVDRFSQNRWSITLDIDELFDYPYSEKFLLSDFLQYLNHKSYNAAITQMLDMFSDKALMDTDEQTSETLKDRYRYYDISNIDKRDYSYSKPENPRIKMYSGGVRNLLGVYCWLTKVSLLKMDGTIRPFIDCHHVRKAKIADISCLLLHYPFFRLVEKTTDAIENERYGKQGRIEFHEKVKHMLHQSPQLTMKSNTSQFLKGTQALIEQDFIVTSDSYQQWVNVHAMNETELGNRENLEVFSE